MSGGRCFSIPHGMTVFQYMLTHLGRYSLTQLFGIPEPVSIVIAPVPSSVIYTTVLFETFAYTQIGRIFISTKWYTKKIATSGHQESSSSMGKGNFCHK